MKGLIAFLMKGRFQAMGGTALFAMLALIITPLAIVSAAIVALATLRNGWREGLLVVVGSAALLGLIAQVTLQFGMVVALSGLLLWLPIWSLASVLALSGSLRSTLEVAALVACFLVGAQYVWLGEPGQFWENMLREHFMAGMDESVVPQEDQQTLVRLIAAWMPGGVAASWLIAVSLSLFLARWAAAKLGRAGAFGEEFRQLRFSKPWLIVVPLLLIVALAGGEQPGMIGQFYLIGMVLFLFQGISMTHGLVAALGANSIWLFGMYFVLIVGAPHSATALAAAGYADGWIDFRAKARADSGNDADR